MDKVTKTYNLLMEGFNAEQKAIWQNKLKQYPQFCNVDEDIWDKYVSCWSAQNWQYENEQIEALTEDQMWNLWNKFMSSPTNYIMFFMGITEPQRVEELYYQVRDQMAQEEQEEHYKRTVNESCFNGGTYNGLKKYVAEDVDWLSIKYEEIYMDTLKKRLKESNIRLQGIPIQAICDQFQEAYHSVSLDKLQRMSEKEFKYIVKEIIHMFKQPLNRWMLTKYF